MKTRNVYISETHDGYDVLYAERRKGQRYRAAGFDKSIADRAKVESWVKARPHLVLVDPPKEKQTS